MLCTLPRGLYLLSHSSLFPKSTWNDTRIGIRFQIQEVRIKKVHITRNDYWVLCPHYYHTLYTSTRINEQYVQVHYQATHEYPLKYSIIMNEWVNTSPIKGICIFSVDFVLGKNIVCVGLWVTLPLTTFVRDVVPTFCENCSLSFCGGLNISNTLVYLTGDLVGSSKTDLMSLGALNPLAPMNLTSGRVYSLQSDSVMRSFVQLPVE